MANAAKALKEKELGNEAYRKRDFSAAHQHYDRSIQLDPTNIILLTNKAAVYFEEGKFEDCIKLCEQAVELGREYHSDFKQIAKAYSRIGNAYLRQDRLKEALQYFDKSISECADPKIVQIRQELEKKVKEAEKKASEEKAIGNEAYQKGDFRTAIKHYTEAIKRNPNDAKLYSNRAACFAKLRQFRYVIEDCDECISLDPTFIKGYLRKGMACMALHDASRALEAYEEALRLDSNSAEALDGIRQANAYGSLEPLFCVFRRCFDPESELPSEEIITDAVDRVKLFYTSSPVDEAFFESFPPDIAVILLNIYFDIKESASYCRSSLKEVIYAFLEHSPNGSVGSLVKRWIFPEASMHWTRRIRFLPGASGGVKATKSNQQSIDIQQRIELLQELFQGLSQEAQARLFAETLKLLQDEDSCGTEASTSRAVEQRPDEVLAILTSVMAQLEINPSLATKERRRMARMMKVLLDKSAGGTGDDEDIQSLNRQNIHLIFGAMATLFGEDVSSQDTKELADLRSALRELSETHHDLSIRSAAKDVYFAICSSPSVQTDRNSASSSRGPEKANYEQALADLEHPLVPVRGHAVISLTNLIRSKDPVACANLDSVIPVLVGQLDEEDSYIYLATVNCLAAAGLFRPKVVLPILMALFKNETRNFDKRLKVGEAIVRISRELGDLAPFYGNDLINAFLSLSHDGDEEIVASCLSNIAEICRLMSMKLNTYITELFYLSQQLLQWDKRSLVRRAAINLLALLTENGDGFLEVLGDSSREFYRSVKEIYERDDDHIVRLHAQKCLENLGEHAKRFLRPLVQMME